MKVTDVRVVLHDAQDNRNRPELLAALTVVFDDQLVVHGIKVIEGKKGLFLSLPNDKKHDHCPDCRRRNSVTASYCNHCGGELDPRRWQNLPANKNGFINLYNDVVHPIDQEFRSYLEDVCIAAYEKAYKEDREGREFENRTA